MILPKVYAALIAVFVMNSCAMEKQDFTKSVAVGGIAGIAEVTCNQWLVTIKNRAQQGHSFTLNPQVLYKGYGMNVACMMPTTALQVGFNNGLKTFIPDNTIIANISRAFCAGAISAVAAGPSELVVITQQNKGGSALESIKRLYAHGGLRVFGRGITLTAVRDGGFTVGYSTLYPIMYNLLKKNMQEDEQSTSNTLAYKAGAGAITGVCTAALTHPADTLKTIMQGDYTQQEYTGIKSTIRTFYKKHGIKGFAKGFEGRATRAVLAIPLIYAVTDYFAQSDTNQNSDTKQ